MIPFPHSLMCFSRFHLGKHHRMAAVCSAQSQIRKGKGDTAGLSLGSPAPAGKDQKIITQPEAMNSLLGFWRRPHGRGGPVSWVLTDEPAFSRPKAGTWGLGREPWTCLLLHLKTGRRPCGSQDICVTANRVPGCPCGKR